MIFWIARSQYVILLPIGYVAVISVTVFYFQMVNVYFHSFCALSFLHLTTKLCLEFYFLENFLFIIIFLLDLSIKIIFSIIGFYCMYSCVSLNRLILFFIRFMKLTIIFLAMLSSVRKMCSKYFRCFYSTKIQKENINQLYRNIETISEEIKLKRARFAGPAISMDVDRTKSLGRQ